VAVVSSLIKSHRLQPHLDVDIEKLVGAVWFSRTSSMGSPDRHGASSSWGGIDVVFLTRLTTSRSQPTR
jgi:hypothetical protein